MVTPIYHNKLDVINVVIVINNTAVCHYTQHSNEPSCHFYDKKVILGISHASENDPQVIWLFFLSYFLVLFSACYADV